MKRKFFSALMLSVFAVIATATASAQMPGTSLRANVPFDFSVRGKILPAGEYQIKRLTDDPGTLLITNVNDSHERSVVQTERVDESEIASKSELIFSRYGDSYFLSEIFAAGQQSGRELVPSSQERGLKRELAANGAIAKPETVAVLAH